MSRSRNSDARAVSVATRANGRRLGLVPALIASAIATVAPRAIQDFTEVPSFEQRVVEIDRGRSGTQWSSTTTSFEMYRLPDDQPFLRKTAVADEALTGRPFEREQAREQYFRQEAVRRPSPTPISERLSHAASLVRVLLERLSFHPVSSREGDAVSRYLFAGADGSTGESFASRIFGSFCGVVSIDEARQAVVSLEAVLQRDVDLGWWGMLAKVRRGTGARIEVALSPSGAIRSQYIAASSSYGAGKALPFVPRLIESNHAVVAELSYADFGPPREALPRHSPQVSLSPSEAFEELRKMAREENNAQKDRHSARRYRLIESPYVRTTEQLRKLFEAIWLDEDVVAYVTANAVAAGNQGTSAHRVSECTFREPIAAAPPAP